MTMINFIKPKINRLSLQFSMKKIGILLNSILIISILPILPSGINFVSVESSSNDKREWKTPEFTSTQTTEPLEKIFLPFISSGYVEQQEEFTIYSDKDFTFHFLYPANLNYRLWEPSNDIDRTLSFYSGKNYSSNQPEIAITVYQNVQLLSLNEWVSLHTDPDFSNLPSSLENSLALFDNVDLIEEVDLSNQHAIYLQQSFYGFNSGRIITPQGHWILSIAYTDFGNGELIPAFLSVVASLNNNSGNGEPTFNEEIRYELENIIKPAIEPKDFGSSMTLNGNLLLGYKLPWVNGISHRVTQGWGGSYSHSCPGQMCYAYDFDMYKGEEIRASRSGRITNSVGNFTSCGGLDLKNAANRVTIDHDDGTATLYLHLNQVNVSLNSYINQGERIGLAGDTGWTGCNPHLHFQRQDQGIWITNSHPIYFDEYEGQQLFSSTTKYTSQNGGGSTSCDDFPTEVRLYDKTNCGGSKVTYNALGLHDLVNSSFNDLAEAIEVPNGWSVRLFVNNSESSPNICIQNTDSNLWDNLFSDGLKVAKQATWIRVYDNDNCSGTQPPGDAITIFEHPNNVGEMYGWHDVGLFNLPDYAEEKASSIRIVDGWSVRVYEHLDGNGGQKCYNSNDSDFTNDTFDIGIGVNDKVSSIEIFNQDNCPASLKPDLKPIALSGYPHPVVPSSIKSTQEVNTLYTNDFTYFDWYFANGGSGTAYGDFYVELWVDDQRFVRYPYSDYYAGRVGGFNDWAEIVLTPGWHTIKLITDPDNSIAESNETNNIWEKPFYWEDTSPNNSPPNEPKHESPLNNTTDMSVNGNLFWFGDDPDGHSVTYDVYLEANDNTPDNIVCIHIASVMCDPGLLSYGIKYFWQVIATDELGRSSEGPVWNFTTIQSNNSPNKPFNPNPADNAIDQEINLILVWLGGDPDGDKVTYYVYFEANDSTPDVLVCNEISGSHCDPGPLTYGTQYYWRVYAEDEFGKIAEGPIWNFTTKNSDESLPTWTLRSSSDSPSARTAHDLVYDSNRGVSVLFGGNNGQFLSDTWEWNGINWIQQTPTNSPPARNYHAMAYDHTREVTVLFGGRVDDVIFDDTWEWDGTNWTKRTPISSPPARWIHSMAYDTNRGVVVLFGGGGDCGGACNDTWEWDGETWTQRFSSMTPSGRWGHDMAFDTNRNVIVLFGGRNYGTLSDSWEWDGTSWYQQTPALNPPDRENTSLAYDSINQVVVLFGGYSDSEGYLGDTWEWNGTSWTNTTPLISPMERDNPALVFDSIHGVSVMFGGYDGSIRLSDTWEYER